MEINKVYNMNCIDGMKQMPDEFIDLTITSPPYDNLRTYNDSSSWNFDIFKQIADELYRVTKVGGGCVWIVNDATINFNETGTSFKQALYFKDIGFNLYDTMIWNKQTCQFPERTRYQPVFEYMFVLSKGKMKTFNPIMDKKNKYAGVTVHGTRRQSDGTLKKINTINSVKENGMRNNVWEIPMEHANKTGHPAVFPKQLIIDHIKSWSNEGDLILDPFMGSGTTALACIDTYRDYIGFEIDKTYYSIIENRLSEATNQLRIE